MRIARITLICIQRQDINTPDIFTFSLLIFIDIALFNILLFI